MITVHNTPKGRASLREGDWLYVACKNHITGHSGLLRRIDGNAYVLDDHGVTIVFPFDRVDHMMRKARR